MSENPRAFIWKQNCNRMCVQSGPTSIENSSIRTYVACDSIDCRLAWSVTNSCGERIIVFIKRTLVVPHNSFDKFSDVYSGVCAVSDLIGRIKIGEVTFTHKTFPAEASSMEGLRGDKGDIE